MQLSYNDTTKKHKGLTPMKAADLFEPDITQVFSRKTGEYLGFYRAGQELTFTDPLPVETKKEAINPKQISLF